MPYEVLSQEGPLATPGTFAATSLTALTDAISAAAKGSPSCLAPSCFSGIDVPPNNLLVAFTPSGPCQQPTGYTVTLASRRLEITTLAKGVCGSGGGGASRQVADTLLAIPLSYLPHDGTVTITTHGPGTPDGSAAIVLGR